MTSKSSNRDHDRRPLKGKGMLLLLVLSLLANLALGFRYFRILRVPPPSAVTSSPPSVAPAKKIASAETASDTKNTGIHASPAPASLAWSSLESDDFRIYIARLRAIGCPELTVRHIIKGELDDLYAEKKHQLAAGRGESGRSIVSASLQKEFDQLNLEEERLLANLLGLAGPEPPGVPGIPSTPRRMTVFENMQAAVALAQPLVFQPVNTAALNLTPVQSQRIEQLRQEFLRMIGGVQQNPQDPEYLTRWRKAQYYVDNIMRTTLGNDFVNRYRAAVIVK